MGTGRDPRLNPFITNPFGDQDWGSQPPEPFSPQHWGTKSSFCLRCDQGHPQPAAQTHLEGQSYGGAQSCEIIHELDLEGEGKKRKKAMSFKVLEMFLFGFSRNKSKEPFALNHGDKKKKD